ncbi:spermatogenesis-associated protein 16-like [Engraulis encrasicolus]|uniref:spermatogenesis-associated protein 16-like n=1 Tax=Engraulis encrasicolus TaxID=184585 RepID=UPI002FD68D36
MAHAHVTEHPHLSRPPEMANLSRRKNTESQEDQPRRERSQTPLPVPPARDPNNVSTNKKRKRNDITEAERTGAADGARGARDGWAEENKVEEEDNGSAAASLPSCSSAIIQRIPVRTLLEIEAKLVFGGEQDITQKSAAAQAPAPAHAGSQLMCQLAEILGPRSGPNLGSLPQIDKWLDVALQGADSCYRQKRYDTAASHFTTALELCSKAAIWEKPCNAAYEDISRVASSIESRLAACYLRMKRPDKALSHSHRSVHLNPVLFHSHLQQAMAHRLLGNSCAAARSAMIADYLHWLSGDSEEHISKLIKQYWQGLLESVITEEEDFSVMFTPCPGGVPTDRCIQHAEEAFRTTHPTFTAYLFTDRRGGHFLPQTAEWGEASPRAYFLTMGFRRSQEGSFLDKLLSRRAPELTGLRAPFSPPQMEDAKKTCEHLGRRILPVLDVIKCTKLAVGFSTGSGLVKRLQYASHLGRLRRVAEQTQVLQQTLTELSVAPYLQDISAQDYLLLQTLMADAVDTLEGRRTDSERVWNEMLKVGVMEELVYELEESFHREEAQRATRREKARVRRRARREQLQQQKQQQQQQQQLEQEKQAPMDQELTQEHQELTQDHLELTQEPKGLTEEHQKEPEQEQHSSSPTSSSLASATPPQASPQMIQQSASPAPSQGPAPANTEASQPLPSHGGPASDP